MGATAPGAGKDPTPSSFRLPLVRHPRPASRSVFGRRPAVKVAALEAVAVAFDGEDLGVVNETSIMAAAVASSPKISPQAENGVLLVAIRLARSLVARILTSPSGFGGALAAGRPLLITGP